MLLMGCVLNFSKTLVKKSKLTYLLIKRCPYMFIESNEWKIPPENIIAFFFLSCKIKFGNLQHHCSEKLHSCFVTSSF